MISEVKRVCFVGAGTMGTYNSLITALAGYTVRLYDISAKAIQDAPRKQREWGRILVKQNLLIRAEALEELMGATGRIKSETKRSVALLDPYIQQGELGEKTGKGFYSHRPANQ